MSHIDFYFHYSWMRRDITRNDVCQPQGYVGGIVVFITRGVAR